MLYFGSPSADIAADFTPEERLDVTIRKQILWESADATDAEVRAKEIELIRELRSNDPEVGYNRTPKLSDLFESLVISSTTGSLWAPIRNCRLEDRSHCRQTQNSSNS